jgi:hypothetical protein
MDWSKHRLDLMHLSEHVPGGLFAEIDRDFADLEVEDD